MRAKFVRPGGSSEASAATESTADTAAAAGSPLGVSGSGWRKRPKSWVRNVSLAVRKKMGKAKPSELGAQRFNDEKLAGSIWCPSPESQRKAEAEDRRAIKNALMVAAAMRGKGDVKVLLTRRSGEDGNPDKSLYV